MMGIARRAKTSDPIEVAIPGFESSSVSIEALRVQNGSVDYCHTDEVDGGSASHYEATVAEESGK